MQSTLEGNLGFDNLIDNLTEVPSESPAVEFLRAQVLDKFAYEGQNAETVVTDFVHANGADVIAGALASIYDKKTHSTLSRYVRIGVERRQREQDEVAAAVQSEVDKEAHKLQVIMDRNARTIENAKIRERKRISAERKAAARLKRNANNLKAELNGSKKPLNFYPLAYMADMKRTEGKLSAAETHPEILPVWDVEKNGCTPFQCFYGTNGYVWLRCPDCDYSYKEKRVNLVAMRIRAGRDANRCPSCNPKFKAKLKAKLSSLRERLKPLVDAMTDAHAFNALSGAMKMALMEEVGLLKGGKKSMERNIMMSVLVDALSLNEVMVNEMLNINERTYEIENDEELLKEMEDVETYETTTDDNPLDVVQMSMYAVGLMDSFPDLAEDILSEIVENLWREATKNDEYPVDLINRIEELSNEHSNGKRLADRFMGEYTDAVTAPLPANYIINRVTTKGAIVRNPLLGQRRFMVLMENHKRFFNFSDPGAGKTIAASLAVINSGAKTVLVVCPKRIVHQWEDEFTFGYTDVEVVCGLPTVGKIYKELPDGSTRVFVAHYDLFQGDPKKVAGKLANLATTVDAIVFDEIHSAKKTGRNEDDGSKRHRALIKFIDLAGNHNADLMVIGMTATPVVNRLEEAGSIVRLIEGPNSIAFPSKPTVRNCTNAYRRLAAMSVRMHPEYPVTLTREYITTDVTDDAVHIQSRLNALRALSPNDNQNASMMERALLPAKLPSLVKSCLEADTSSLVFVQYTTGMVNQIREACEDAGLTVGVFIGTGMTDAERKKSFEDHLAGKTKVLICSSSMATGVDGLQSVSANLVVASMTWAAAHDDQLVGRLHRHGQTRNVTVTYLLTEIPLENGGRWSWCKDRRLSRVENKRTLADAVSKGVIPQGMFEAQEAAITKFADSLDEIVMKQSVEDDAA